MQDMGYSGAGMGQYPPSYERSYHGQHPSMGMPPSSMGGGYRMPMAHHDGAMAQWSGLVYDGVSYITTSVSLFIVQLRARGSYCVLFVQN